MTLTRPTDRGVRLTRGSTRPFPVAVVIVTALILWTTSFPGAPTVGVLLVLLGLIVVPVLWTRLPRRGSGGRHRGWAALVSVVVVAGAMLAGVAGLPVQARFALDAKSYEAAVAGLPDPAAVNPPLASGSGYPDFPGTCPSRIGTSWITECHTFDDAYIFFQGWSPVSDEAGIAYLPSGTAADDPDSGFRHLSGPWYTWRQEPMVR